MVPQGFYECYNCGKMFFALQEDIRETLEDTLFIVVCKPCQRKLATVITKILNGDLNGDYGRFKKYARSKHD